ncbi:sodium/proline symporter [Thalassotalea sp. 1_MG-2023]|uniref:sodium/proline symporter n=1 Tax=Thalassotalea sp. 1_MG-2023 TaxID=3062680 RepID=UPI0026E252AE|nr:sodium/proline symporter [Thalassotalea sp. 1_MG-2023]MDO6427711.1 sodium/proline symporter [Thalassotalea sp. 1_MG-2023]
MTLSFICFLTLFALIGLSSAFQSKGNKSDYYLASESVSPWLVGLSAVATNNSGYMFIGVIGYTYVTGLASIWLMAGWILGDFLASLYVHKQLKEATAKTKEVSFAGVLSNWHGKSGNGLQRIIGLISLAFLITYAAAQLLAGSKALHVLLDWPLWYGAVIGAVLVCLYCFFGGIRASIWTDAAQSIVMIVAMSILLVTAVNSVGGLEQAYSSLATIDGYMDWTPEKLLLPGVFGLALFIISWIFAGLSVIGQPHVMVRFMTLNNADNMFKAKLWYYLWFTSFYCMATAVGMLSRLFIADTGSFDAELALPTLAQHLLPEVLVGLILAGIFAATMSTTDSLVLSCSSAVTHDISSKKIEKTWVLKATTTVVTFIALLLALTSKQSVFNMVIMAWSGLASAFAPLLITQSLGGRPNQLLSITAIFVGFAVALLWRMAGLTEFIYEGLPGIIIGLLIFYIGLSHFKLTLPAQQQKV